MSANLFQAAPIATPTVLPREKKSQSCPSIAKKMATHLLAVALPLAVIVVALMNYSYFSWHPILMTIAFGFLMTEGVHVFSPSSSLVAASPRDSKIRVHAISLFLSLFCALGGFWVIYSNKNANGWPHFKSWHGLLGLIAVCYCCVQVPAGVLVKLAPSLKLPPGLTLRDLKFYHSMSGCTLYVLGCVSIGLGLYSNWFSSNAHEYVWGACTIASVLLGMLGLNHMFHILQSRSKAPAKGRK